MSKKVDDHREEGVEFSCEGDLVTARDIETGVASSGDSKAEAFAMLAEALALHEGGGNPIEDEDQFLRDIGIDPDAVDEDETPPPWLG